MVHSISSTQIFVDAGIDALPQLLRGVDVQARLHVLSPSADGVAEIGTALDGTADSVVIVAHGAPGCLYLGRSELSLSTLERYRPQLSRWFDRSQHPQLLLYGCQVAAGDAGAEFLARLQQITGAHLGASTRLVGHQQLGGTWQLDTTLGEPQPLASFTHALAESYRAVLAPGNDTFAVAEDLTGTSDTSTGSNVDATAEPGELVHDPTVSGLSAANQQQLNDSVWWKWTAPADGEVAVDTFGSAIDTVLAVYVGSSVDGLTRVGRNDNAGGTPQSQTTFTATANTTYYFAVDGSDDAQGALQITLNTPPEIAAGQIYQVSETAEPTDPPFATVSASETGLSWSIVGGNPDADGDGTSAFAVDAATGALRVADADDLDFEGGSSLYPLQISASDGSFTTTEAVFVEVTDGPEVPVLLEVVPSQSTVGEGSLITLSGQFSDPDSSDTQTVTIDWGDGSTTTVANDDLVASGATHAFARNHTYRDNGAYIATVTVRDASGAEDQLSRTITVNNVAPTITQEAVNLSTNEDQAATVVLSATDASASDPLTWSLSGEAMHGIAKISASPTGSSQLITYTPDANFNGADSFTVQVADGDGGTDEITINVGVNPQPDSPANLQLATSTAALNEGDGLTLTGSFRDPDLGDSFELSIQWGDGGEPTRLSSSDLQVGTGGLYSFAADHTYLGDSGGAPASIVVTVTDGSGLVASASMPVIVTNLPPEILQGETTSFSIQEDTAGSLVLNAVDAADGSLSWSIASQGVHGTATLAAPAGGSQSITYVPNANFTGLDRFEVSVSDDDGGISTLEVIVGVDPVNDAPTALTLDPIAAVSEGDAITLSGSFTDIDAGDTHTVTVDWGDGSVATVEAVALGAGSLTLPSGLSHGYADEGNYTVTVTATDAAGAAVSATATAAVSNGAPTITTPGSPAVNLVVAEDGSVSTLLAASDPGNQDRLQWTLVKSPQNGAVALSGSGGSQQLSYTPDMNFAGTDSFEVQVADGDGGSDTVTYTVTVNGDNDLPVVVANGFAIAENTLLQITTDMLDAADIETTDDSQIVFTISNLTAGDSFVLGGAPTSRFTRAELVAGSVSFIDGGDSLPPAFTITVADGSGGAVSEAASISFTPTNDAPLFNASNAAFTVAEGGTTSVRATHISATDEESAPQSLTFTVNDVVGGSFLVNGVGATTFTQAKINANAVRFRHNGSETAPSYTLTVSDGELSAQRQDSPTFVPSNDAPVLLANGLVIAEGGTVVLSPTELNATDVETLDNALQFTLSGIAGGEFLLDGDPFAGAVSFTLEDLILERVSFVHDGSEAAPSYTVTVTDDGSGAAAPRSVTAPATVSFSRTNDAPDIVANGFTVAEGQRVLIVPSHIDAVDETGETPRLDLQYAISDLVGGRFEFGSAPGVATTEFSQRDVDQRRIVFVHDGSSTAPSYTLTVSDAEGATSSAASTVQFSQVNSAPAIGVNQLTLAEGDTVVLTPANLNATDAESSAAELTFSVTVSQGGEFQVAGAAVTQFTLQQVIDGAVSFVQDGTDTVPAYTVTATDTEPAGAVNPGSLTSAASTAAVTFTPRNDAPVVTASSFEIREGEAVVLSAAQLAAGDEETTDATQLTYTVDAVVNGSFQRVGSDEAITDFTQAEVNGGQIQFVHDGSEAAPSYTLTLEDAGGQTDTAAVIFTEGLGGFINQNDLPQLLSNRLTVDEGGTVVLSTADLSASDLETLNPDLRFTLDGITGGQFLLSGAPLPLPVGFTLADVIEERISFVHDDSETVPAYTVTVTDGDGGSSAAMAAVVTLNRTNDAPEIVANGFVIAEGETIILTSANIAATDEAGETPAQQLQFSVSDVVGGRFALATDTTTAIIGFSQSDIDQQRVVFVQDPASGDPGYTLTVTDGEGGSATASDPAIQFSQLNSAPTILTNQLNLGEGETVVLTPADLNATDEESGPAQLSFDVTVSRGGEFQVGGAAVTRFTLQQVIDRAVSFVQDGSDTAPAYSVTVTDTEPAGAINPGSLTSAASEAAVSFTAVNDAPLLTAQSFEIREGEAVLLSSAQLSATDEESIDPAQLVYIVDSVVNGSFQRLGSSEALATFTQGDVNSGQIQFVHDGSEVAPSYVLTVQDAGGQTDTAAVNFVEGAGGFINQNDLPLLLSNRLAIAEGGRVVLSTAELSAEDLESLEPGLQFIVENIVGGQFFIDDVTVGAPVSFALADVIQGRISFVHDGSETVPSYRVSVTDSEGGSSAPAAVTVEFSRTNDAPEIVANGFAVDEGAIAILTSANLSATDELGETPAGELQYVASDVVGGRFALASAVATAITSFSQQDIDQQRIVFVHNGSATAPSYTLTVSDGEGGTVVDSQPAITFAPVNDRPEFAANGFSLAEGDLITLNLQTLAATDADHPASQLSYRIAAVEGGSFLLNGAAIDGATPFRQLDIALGRLQFQDDGDELAPSYTVEVSDPGGASTTQAAQLSFTPVNDAPTLAVNRFDILEGALLTLSAANLQMADAETADPTQLTYAISELVAGQFFRSDAPATAITTFTQQDVLDGAVVFAHDDSDTPPSFTLTLEDGIGGVSEVAANIASFTSENDAPQLQANQLAVAEGETLTLTEANLSAVDPDSDASELRFTISELAGGTFFVDGVAANSFTLQNLVNDQVVFVDDDDDTAPSYQVSVGDGAIATPTAAATIAYTPVNDLPVATDDGGAGFATTENARFTTGDVLANDTDDDPADLLTVTAVDGLNIVAGGAAITLPSGAFLALEADGRRFRYDPGSAFDALGDGAAAQDSFVYTLRDSAGATTTATVTVDIAGANDVPRALGDGGAALVVSRRESVTLNLLANDTDADLGDSLRITALDGVAAVVGVPIALSSGSTATVNGDGTVTYTPGDALSSLQAGETVGDSFTYTVADTQNAIASASVSLTVVGFTAASEGYLAFNQYAQLLRATTGQGLPWSPVEYGQVTIAQLFDETQYLAANGDIAAAVASGTFTSGYEHFVQYGWLEGRNPSTLYDERFYLSENPDVAAAVAAGAFSSGFQHFILDGHREGRDPSQRFSQQDYLAANTDVQAGVADGLIASGFEHFVEYGSQEGRMPHLSLFEESSYLAQNPDVVDGIVAGALVNGFEHYVNFGQKEGRSPGLLFEEASYLSLNPDVQGAVAAGAFASGFEHYIRFGRAENRPVTA